MKAKKMTSQQAELFWGLQPGSGKGQRVIIASDSQNVFEFSQSKKEAGVIEKRLVPATSKPAKLFWLFHCEIFAKVNKSSKGFLSVASKRQNDFGFSQQND